MKCKMCGEEYDPAYLHLCHGAVTGSVVTNFALDPPSPGVPVMSLRDWFAGLAMQRFLDYSEPYAEVAKDAYQLADAMLAERERKPEEEAKA